MPDLQSAKDDPTNSANAAALRRQADEERRAKEASQELEQKRRDEAARRDAKRKLEAELAQTEQKLRAAETKLTSAERELESLNKDERQATAAQGEAGSELRDLKSRMTALEQKIAKAESELRSTAAKEKTLDKEIKEDEAKSRAEAGKDPAQELDALRRQLNDLRREEQTAKSTEERESRDLIGAERTHEVKEQALKKLEADVATLRRELETKQRELELLHNEVEKESRALDAEKANAGQNSREDVRRREADTEKKVKELEEQSRSGKKLSERAEQLLGIKKQEIERLEAQIAAQEKIVTDAQNELKNLKRDADTAEHASRDHGTKGVIIQKRSAQERVVKLAEEEVAAVKTEIDRMKRELQAIH